MKNFIRNNSAYALIEIISVFLLISILSAYVLTSGIDINADLEGEVEIVKSHLRYVQYLALTNEDNSYKISFTDNSYTLFKNTDPMNFPNEDSATHTLPTELTISVPNLPPATKTISFVDKWGSPDDAYEVTISDSSGNKKIFNIIKNTGAIL